MESANPVSRPWASGARALAYFLSFRTYASWLPGDARGWVDRRINQSGTKRLAENQRLHRYAEAKLLQAPLVLDEAQRRVCEQAMRETCGYRGWRMCAINVRTNHVHVVVSAEQTPERVMRDLKAYATRALRQHGLIDDNRRVWARHGSTQMIYTPEGVQRACIYTVERQGAQLGYAPAER